MNTPDPDKIDVSAALKRGKKEWLKNAPWTYGTDATHVWDEDILPRFL